MGHSYLQQKILRHNYLEKENIGTYIYLEPKYTGAQLFRGKTYWDTAIIDAKHFGTQLFRSKPYWGTAN